MKDTKDNKLRKNRKEVENDIKMNRAIMYSVDRTSESHEMSRRKSKK